MFLSLHLRFASNSLTEFNTYGASVHHVICQYLQTVFCFFWLVLLCESFFLPNMEIECSCFFLSQSRILWTTLRKKYPYLQFFWSVFSRIRTDNGDLKSKTLYSVRMQENACQKNSKLFLRNARVQCVQHCIVFDSSGHRYFVR